MSAVVQEKHVETIFDYELTDAEKAVLVIDQSVDEYISTHDQESINLGLMFLFAMRNDRKRADFYKSKLDPAFVKTHLNWDRVVEAA